MPLASSEVEALAELEREHGRTAVDDERLLRYYRGAQRLEQLGMAIPPNMRRFVTVVNWPRVVVDTIEHRQSVRSLVLPGEDTADPQLRAIWDASNLSAHTKMFNRDRMIYGRAFMSVGANANDQTLPYVRVESPREMTALVDVRTERVRAAARFYKRPTDETGHPGPDHATLYLPDSTIWLTRSTGGAWEEDAEHPRNDHQLGAVPVVMHLNRRMSGSWQGESEMTDIIPLTDSAARTLTNLQFTMEAHGAPRKFMTGVEKGEFVDAAGEMIPQWEAYFDAIHLLSNPQGKVGQLEGADVKNFETAINIYGKQAATVTGFPARYFGLHTTNPPAEGAIRADEAQLVETVESQNEEVGMTLGWMGSLALRFATGDWTDGNRVRVDWHDPATPTVAQREDALSKRRAAGVLSREGYWDELGWSEARKAKERAYFEQEQADLLTRTLVDELTRGNPAPAPDVA